MTPNRLKAKFRYLKYKKTKIPKTCLCKQNYVTIQTRHSITNHCDRLVTRLVDTDTCISFALFNLFINFFMHFECKEVLLDTK